MKTQHLFATLTVATLAALAPTPASATDFDSEFAVPDDFGDVGLMQTPTARMRPDGELGLGVSTVRPYNQVHMYLQALPWLETVVRYTDVTDAKYVLADAYGNYQHYKDKSADFKIRLAQEGDYWPEVSMGIQAFGGVGILSSEFFVGSYHYYDLDFSFGLGWGRLGAGGDIPNPFGIFGHHFNQPRSVTALGNNTPGALNTGRLFTGKTIGPFGGIEWNTPVKHLKLQLEYDGNDYEHEALNLNIPQATQINLGLSYEPLKGLHLAAGYERGNKFTARIDWGFGLNRAPGPAKVSDPPPLPVVETDSAAPQAAAAQPGAAPLPPPSPEELESFVLALKQKLADQDIEFIGLNPIPDSGEVQVWFAQDKYRNPAKAAGRVARVLSVVAPARYTRFTMINVQGGAETCRVSLLRHDFDLAANGDLDLDQLLDHTTVRGPDSGALKRALVLDDSRFPKFSWDTAPALRQNIGGPDEFYATQFWWRFDGGVALNDHWSMSSTIGVNVWNNFDKLKQQSNSLLPHVRSDISDYLKAGPNNLVKLETDYIWSPFSDIYARGSLGIFEEMYGGVAGEVLYRPYGSDWALSVDANYVRQRAFNQRFSFLNYRVATGFATLYYQVPYANILAQLTVGRYLAKDKGATLDLSRRFANGVRCGLFATKTNVSGKVFGEGSFDKGLYIMIPLDLFFTTSSRSVATTVFRPLTRDGGQRPADGPQLYWVTDNSSPSDFAQGAGDLLH